MKTRNLFLIVMLLFVLPVMALTIVQEPEEGYSYVFASLASMLVIIPVVTEFVKAKTSLSGKGLQVFSWGIGFVLAFIGFGLKLGMFAEASVLETILTGAGISLASNGLADTGIITWLLGFLHKK